MVVARAPPPKNSEGACVRPRAPRASRARAYRERTGLMDDWMSWCGVTASVAALMAVTAVVVVLMAGLMAELNGRLDGLVDGSPGGFAWGMGVWMDG